jgi:hypothetical protein
MDQIHRALGKRPLAQLFLNRISHTGSISYPRIPTRRHSGAAAGVVILVKPQESSFWRSQNLSICLCSATALQENRCKPHQMNTSQQLTPNQSFAGATRSKSLFFTHNPYSLNLLSASSTQ